MKFLDKYKLRRLEKIASVAAVSGALIFGENANAAPNDEDNIDALAAFHKAYLNQTTAAHLIEQDLSLISNKFHFDIDSKAQVTEDGIMMMSGELSWSCNNLKKNYSTNNFIPF